MSGTVITGLTAGGDSWIPKFVTAVDAHSCIGCGRCYKVCSREVFNLVDKADLVDEDEDEEDDGTPSSEGSGAGHVLPPDNLYQEPNEVPIPHHSKRERPDS